MGESIESTFNSLYWVQQPPNAIRGEEKGNLSIPFIGFTVGLCVFQVFGFVVFQFPLLGSTHVEV